MKSEKEKDYENTIVKINEATEIKRIKGIVEEVLINHLDLEWTRFDSKQAWYTDRLSTPTGQYRLFKSYNTIVALVDIYHGKFYELGKWSTTTSKQVTQFYNSSYGHFTRCLLV